MSDFGVFVWFASGTPEIWGQVEATPAEELAPLTREQKETAKRRGITEEDYQRNLLHQRLSEERFQKLGTVLGEAAKQVLDGLGQAYQLLAVLIYANRDRWVLRVRTPKGHLEIPVEAELRDQVLSSDDVSVQEAFKCELLSSLGRSDLIPSR